MEKDSTTTNHYYIAIDKLNINQLAPIRRWNHLKIAIDGNIVWITNFSIEEIESVAVKSLTNKKVYYAKNSKLYLLNHLLPATDEPKLKWLPFEEALPLKVPAYNHNYFGISEKISIKLIPDYQVRTASAMLINIKKLGEYLRTASKIRLKNLKWVLVNETQTMIFGNPILPINSKVYWLNGSSFLPAGFNFELPILKNNIEQLINNGEENWIVWNEDSTYFKINKAQMMPLSLSSYKNSNYLNNTIIKNE